MAKTLEERRRESKKRREEGALYASSLDVRRDQAQLRNAINYDTLQDDLTVANDIVKNTYSGWQNAESMKANRDTVFNMQKRLSAYNDYQNKYGTNWSEEQSKSLGNVLDFYNSAVASWDDTASVYGNYKNKSAYDKALEFKKLDDKYKGSSYEDIQNALKTARNNEYEYLSQYKNYNSLADFDKALSADSNNKELKQARNRYILDNAYEAYAYNKEDPEYEKLSSTEYQYPVRSADEAKTLNHLLSQLTDDERRMANYIGNKTQDKEKYRDYLQSIEVSVSKREYDKNFEKASQFADNHPWLSTIGTWLTNPFAEIGSTVESVAAPLLGQNYNPYANLSGVYNFGQDVRGEVSENFNDAYGDTASFLYDTGNSIVDTFTRNAINKALGIGLFGNNKELVDKFMKVMTTSVGGGVFASAYKDALENGYDQNIIYKLAISQGLAEIAFEEISLDKLLKDQSVDGLKKGIKAVLGQIGTEASEEFNTEVANMITQALFLGEQSDYGRLAAELRERGYSDDEIKSEILKQGFNQLSMAALGGALSGGVIGSFGAYGQYNENRNIGDAVVQSKGVNTLGEKANGEYADFLNKKYDKNLTRATNAELGVLYKETYDTASKELYGKANDDLRASIQDRLIQLGEGEESAPVIADAIVKEVNEEKLTKEEKSVLKSETAQAVLEETMSNKLDTTISEDTVKASENLTEIKDLTANITENDIQNVDFKGKKGTITTKDGKSVSFNDANLSSNAMYMVKASATMDDIERKAYFDNFTKGNNVRSYSQAFELIFNKGMNSEDISYLIDNEAMRISLNGIKHITEVYKAGVEARKASVESIKNTLGNDSAFYRKWKNQFTRGTFTADTINYNNLNGVQKELYHFAEALSNLGFNIELINDSKKSNGMYTHKDNSKVTLNLSATYSTDVNDDTKYKFVIPTISHEFTHLIEYNSPELFAELKEMIKDAFGEEMWNKWIEKEKTDYKHHHTGSLTTKNAESEVVARACEDMMADPDMLSKVLSQGSESTLKKLQRALADFFDKIKDFVNDILGAYKSDSVEATIIREVDGMVDVMREVWAKGLADALKNIQGRESTMLKTNANEVEDIGLVIDAKTESVAPTDLNSERTWTQSEYVEERESTAEKIAKELNVSKDQALKYIDDINSVAKRIAEDRVRYDYEANLDPNATVIKSNSEYKWSVDMSTLCAKRLLFTGTFDAIQKAFPNTAFDSEDIVLIRKIMEDRGYQVACGICYVESTRREIGVITEEFINQYKKAQKTGKAITRINSEGVEKVLKSDGKNFYAEKNYTPTLADLNTTDIDLVKTNHPEVYGAYLAFMNARGQAKPKLLETRAEYKGEILEHFKKSQAVSARNRKGGLRVQSFSDFEVVHLIDMMQIVMDMSRVGLKSQAYTKVPAFADAFGNTGIKINLSLIAKGDGLDENGNLIFDDVEGMNHEEAFKLRDKYSKNVGTILVGKNDAHIIAAMADPRIDFIIPFHKSSWKESLYEALGLTGYSDYTASQNEKAFDKDREIKNFDPSEYWDFTKSGDENAKIYLEKCTTDGRIPKFPQFQNYPGYWKLLIDFKMYDNDGVGSPQQVVRPIFNDDVNQRILNKYEGGHRSFPVAQDVVDDFVEYKKTGVANNFDASNDTLHSDRISVMNAPIFYSKMSKEIENIKSDKIGANSVVSYLKGKGVKDEEIKWSGIETFLEGKKSVTKADLQEFAKGSMLQIEEEMLESNGEGYYDTESGRTYTEADLGYNAQNLVDSMGYDSYEINYEPEKAIIDFYQDGEIVESLDFPMSESGDTKYGGSAFTTDGTTNYREILFKMPGSYYSNDAMGRHWDERKGILAHARIDDITTSDGGKMLFVEEIQSDWHNAGSKEGYATKETIANRRKRFIVEAEKDIEDGSYYYQLYDTKLHAYSSIYFSKDKAEEIAKVRNEEEFSSSLVPDAPFKNGKYIEFVMKRLLRMATEEGYDSIGWTTGKMQEDRWSDEFAEGYRIEYDQDIPKFMNKYGKQWGARVEKTQIDNGDWFEEKLTDVWTVKLTPSMKDSVLTKGQPLFSDRVDSDGNSLSKKQVDFFKDSKVRDENGNLKVFYHGASVGFGFTVFDSDMSDDGRSFFFTDKKKIAQGYASSDEEYKDPSSYTLDDLKKLVGNSFTAIEHKNGKYQVNNYTYGPRLLDTEFEGNFEELRDYVLEMYGDISGRGIYKVYLNLKNPLVIDAEYSWWENVPFDFGDGRKEGTTREISEYAKNNGYDGVIINNIFDDADGRIDFNEAIAFNSNQIKLTSNEDPSEDEDIRYSDRFKVTDIKDDTYKELKSHFGTTTNYNVAGYMLKDGTMLDFSGKHWGDTTSKSRQVDHRDIQEVLPSNANGVDAMVNMISNGNIRLMPENGGINLSVAPTDAQKKVLASFIRYHLTHGEREVNVDFDEVGGDTVKSLHYEHGTTDERILKDIDNYFRGGHTSDLMMFHTMYSDRKPTYKNIISTKITPINVKSTIPIETDGRINAKAIYDSQFAKCVEYKTGEPGNEKVHHVVRMPRNNYGIEISNNAMNHGVKQKDGSLIKTMHPSKVVNLAATEHLVDALKSSVTIGQLPVRKNTDGSIDKTYVNVAVVNIDGGVAEGSLIYRFVINHYKNGRFALQKYNVSDNMYALNAKKVETKGVVSKKSRVRSITTFSPSTVSDIIPYVNSLFLTDKGEIDEVTVQLNDYWKNLKDYPKNDDSRPLESTRQEADLKRKSEEIDKITKTSKEFADWIKKDNTKHPVPDVLKQPIVELLQAIDFTSKRGLGLTGGEMKGEKTKNDLALLKAMDAIYSITVDREKLISEGEVSDLDLPPTFSEDVREMVKKLTDIHMKVQEAGVFTLQLMSLDDLKNLNQMLNILKRSVSQMNKMISAKGTVYIAPLSQETIQTANSYGEKGIQNIVQNFLENQEALPYYMFNRLGKGAMTIFASLQDGWDAYAKNADAIIKFSKETWTGKEAREWGKELHEFTLLEKETVPGQPGKQIQVQMSTAQIMSLYCLGKRGQAQGHIFGSGLVMEDIDKLKQPFSVTITDTSFKQITDTLTERQKQVADAIQKYMNTVCSDWGNEISMERFGIKSFTEENYFPIESDPDVLNKDLSDNASSLYRLLNMSFTKELTEKANNQIIIRNIFTVFANHASDMAKYNTLALPVLDTIRWFNYKEKATNGKTTSLRKELSKAYGDQMPGYVTRFLKDLNGTQETGRGENLGRAMLKRYKTAMVGANIQTALLQPLSYIRAAAVISPKYLLKGLSKSAYKECFEKSGIAKWKELGFFDTDISKGLQSMITQDEEVYDKILEGSLKLAEWGDTFTWGWLWTAVKAEIRDTTNLKGKEFDEAVEKRFREVIYRTQVIDSTMTRSDLMRSKSLWTQSITSFMSEPTVTMNMLTDLYENIMLEYRKTGNFNASFKKYGKNISRVASVYAVSALVESALRSAIGKWKGDDKDFDELLKEHFVDEMNVLNKYPIARDLVSIWQGYSVTRSEEDVFQKLYYAMNKITRAIEKGEWDYATTKSLLTAASELSGLPIANGMKEVIAIWNQTIGRMYPNQKIK